jgi:hypothetical protein
MALFLAVFWISGEPTKIGNVVVKGWLGRIALRRFLQSIGCGST